MAKGETPIGESVFANLTEEVGRKRKIDGSRQEKTPKGVDRKLRRKKNESGIEATDLELAEQKLREKRTEKIEKNNKKLSEKKANGYNGGKGLQGAEKIKTDNNNDNTVLTSSDKKDEAVYTAKEVVNPNTDIISESPKKKKLVIARGKHTELADDEKDVITPEDIDELDKESRRMQDEAKKQKNKNKIVSEPENKTREIDTEVIENSGKKDETAKKKPEEPAWWKDRSNDQKEFMNAKREVQEKKEKPLQKFVEDAAENTSLDIKKQLRELAIEKEAERIENDSSEEHRQQIIVESFNEKNEKIEILETKLAETERKLTEVENRLNEEIEKNTTLQQKKGIVEFLKKNKKNILILSGLVGASAATGGLAGAGYALGSAGLGEIVRRKIARDEKKNVLLDEEEKEIIKDSKISGAKSEKEEPAPNFLSKFTKRLTQTFLGLDKKNIENARKEEKTTHAVPEIKKKESVQENQESAEDKDKKEKIKKELAEYANSVITLFKNGKIDGKEIFEFAETLRNVKNNHGAECIIDAFKKIWSMDVTDEERGAMVDAMVVYAKKTGINNKEVAEKYWPYFENKRHIGSADTYKWLTEGLTISETEKEKPAEKNEKVEEKVENINENQTGKIEKWYKDIDSIFTINETNFIAKIKNAEDLVASIENNKVSLSAEKENNSLAKFYHDILGSFADDFDRTEKKFNGAINLNEIRNIVKSMGNDSAEKYFDAILEKIKKFTKESKKPGVDVNIKDSYIQGVSFPKNANIVIEGKTIVKDKSSVPQSAEEKEEERIALETFLEMNKGNEGGAATIYARKKLEALKAERKK